jgi:integrase
MAIRAWNGKWQVDVTFRGNRKKGSAETVEEARLLEASLLQEMVDEHKRCITERPGTPSVWTLSFAYTKCLQACWEGKRSEASNKMGARAALAFFGEDCPLDEVTAPRIEDYKSALKRQENRASTINRKLAVLSKILNHAVLHDGLRKTPHIAPEDKPLGRIRVLSESEEEKVLKLCAKDQDLTDVLCMLVDTGARESELWLVQPEDVNLDIEPNGTVSLWRTKTNRPRTLPLTRRVRAILERRMEKVRAGSLFPFSEDWLTNKWRTIRREMGMKRDRGFVPYCLRHTCATRLVQRGIPSTHVQKWMGHASFKTTEIYIHLRDEDLLSAVIVLERDEGMAKPVLRIVGNRE